jgi:tRNA A-37 threonylcarbamoyl transferase component Bud32
LQRPWITALDFQLKQLTKAKGGELSGIVKSGTRTSKRPTQHLMSMDIVRTIIRSYWPIHSGLISYAEFTLKDFLVDLTSGLGCSTLVYKRLIGIEVDEALRLTSATDKSSTSFCLQLNRLLVEILHSYAKDMIYSPGVLCLPPKTQKKLLKEFYRIVKEATTLIRLCCNQESWLMTAFCMVDSGETFALRCSELLWFKRVVGSYEIGEELDWNLRWETALVEDRSQLQENVRKVAQDTSTKEFHLAGNLSRRLEDTQGAIDPGAHNHVVYLNLEGLNVHDKDEPLGKGATAEVYKATWQGEVFAVKKFQENLSELAAKEVSIATKVHHPNIVPMLGRLQVHEGTDEVLMELMSSSLLSYVQARKRTKVWWFTITPFDPLVGVDMMLQIAEAMRYLHENNIAHLDLKAQNILVNLISDSVLAEEGYVTLKLVDFGCSRINVNSSTKIYESYLGTTLDRAPEILTGNYTRSVDIYGFALVSYRIMTGNEPFPKPGPLKEFKEKVTKGDRPKWRLIDPYPSSLKTLIEECWSGNELKRPAFASICKRLRRIKGFLITGSYDVVEELPTHEVMSPRTIQLLSMLPQRNKNTESALIRPDGDQGFDGKILSML